jgi:hypothetical protein
LKCICVVVDQVNWGQNSRKIRHRSLAELEILAWSAQGSPQGRVSTASLQRDHKDFLQIRKREHNNEVEPFIKSLIKSQTRKMNRGGGGGGRKVLLPPINFIFKLLQQHSTVQIWLYEQLAIRIEGRIRVSCPDYGCFISND